MLLHHGWHMDTRHHEWDGDYFTIGFLHLDLELQETFADWAADVSKRIADKPLPYGVFYNLQENFNGIGEYIDREDGAGHTCATFLLDLFASGFLPLVDLKSWPTSRPGDLSWLRGILRDLRQYVGVDHWLAQVSHRHKMRRYRPEEVASVAFDFSGTPLTFEVVEPRSKKLLLEMKKPNQP